MILHFIKNHIQRVWKGEEAFWRIACLFIGLISSVYLIDRDDLWNLYVLFFYIPNFIASYAGFITLLIWVGCFIIYAGLILYTLLIICSFLRKKRVLKPSSLVAISTESQNSNVTNKKSLITYVFDILLILWAFWTAYRYELWLVGIVSLLAAVYLILGILTIWYTVLCSKVSFIYRAVVFILFPVIPFTLASLNYSGFCLNEGRWYSDKEKIWLAIETLNSQKYGSTETNQTQQKHIPYKNIDEFLAKNPDCCKVSHPPFKGSEGLWGETSLFGQKIWGFLGERVSGRFQDFYKSTDGSLKSQIVTFDAEMKNCGVIRVSSTPK